MATNYSYWERSSFLNTADVLIVGSGLVGLSAALHLKQTSPKLTVTVLDSGFLPSGASTKNAGFACFGTVSELLGYIKRSSEDEMLRMVDYKYRGLQKLRTNLGDKNIQYFQHGGYELFRDNEQHEAEKAIDAIQSLNKSIAIITGDTDIYSVADAKIAGFGLAGIKHMICNKFEGQIDTGLMMRTLITKVQAYGVLVLNNCHVQQISEYSKLVQLHTNQGVFSSKKVIVANNAFVKELYPELAIMPGRGQVLVTKPIENLKIKGTFHFNEGYYYFRNIDNRVLFGGGRNLDLNAEETTEFGNTSLVQKELERYLNEMILRGQNAHIDYWWSGIMGFGEELTPIIKQLQPAVYCAVRCNGMGIAMGSLLGEEVAELVLCDI